MLKNFWYALDFSEDVGPAPRPVTCLGQRLVLYRTPAGNVVCMSDLCVHRGGQLSGGWLKGDCLVCPYHGWEYEPDGACTRIPANPPGRSIPKKARVDSYPTQERYGFVWVFLGDLPEAERPPLPEWPEFSDPSYRAVRGTFHWNANYERILENGCDIAHTPFVHAGVFGNPEKPQVEDYEVELGEWSARTTVRLHPPKPRGVWSKVSTGRRDLKERPPVVARTGWYLPNLVRLEVNLPLGQLVIYDTNIPVSENETVVKWIALRNFFTQRIFDGDSRRRVHKVFLADEKVVLAQRPELLPFDLADELHLKSDALAIAYRRRRRELLEKGWGIDADRIEGTGPRRTATVIPSPARRENPELHNAWVMRAVGSAPVPPRTAAAGEPASAGAPPADTGNGIHQPAPAPATGTATTTTPTTETSR